MWTAMLLLVAAGFIILWFVPVHLELQLHQQSIAAVCSVYARAPFIKVGRSVDITAKVAMVLEHVWKRWRQTGEPVKVPLQKSIRRAPRRKMLRVLARPLRYLGQRSHVQKLGIAAEVGGRDAMESALLVGWAWAAVGTGVGWITQYVSLDPNVPAVQIVPNFQRPSVSVHVDCIVRFRLGHAIVAVLWLLRRAIRERELVAWVRDSLRRKGVEGDGRASDSGPDEDGHGEPEGHG